MLATIAFPLVVKSLLRSQGLYNLSDKDLAQLNSFEFLFVFPAFHRYRLRGSHVPPPGGARSERLANPRDRDYRSGTLSCD